MRATQTIPVLRIFDEEAARAFYVDFLGFTVDWEHRFEPDLPLYQQISRDGCVLHLTGHHGDCCPGSAVRVNVEGIEAFHAVLLAKRYKHARPGLEETAWGTREVSVTDPFGNRLTFAQYDEEPE